MAMQLSEEQKKAIETQKEQCPFCKIIKGEIPAKKVYEDDKILAVLDINPANKGHTLVMPKEHYPIMPLIPPEIFEHLAVRTRELSKSIKDGMLVFGNNIFIANGAAAGQQSQHFMFHIIPREENDGISTFEFEKIDVDKEKEAEAFKILSNNLPRTLKDIYKRFPMKDQNAPKVAYSKEELLKIIEMNPQLKQAITQNPQQFKQMIPNNPQLKELFANIDVDDIIEAITGKRPEPVVEAEVKEETDANDTEQSESKEPEETDAQNETEDDETGNEADIYKILDGNPKLKTLLLEQTDILKQKIEEVPQLKEIFEGHNLDELKEEVEKRDGIQTEDDKPETEEESEKEHDETEEETEIDNEYNEKDEHERTEDDDVLAELKGETEVDETKEGEDDEESDIQDETEEEPEPQEETEEEVEPEPVEEEKVEEIEEPEKEKPKDEHKSNKEPDLDTISEMFKHDFGNM